jgi:hypothetical protein
MNRTLDLKLRSRTHVVLRARNIGIVPDDGIAAPGKGTGSRWSSRPRDLEFHLARTGVGLNNGIKRGTIGILDKLSACNLELGGIYWFTKNGNRGGIDDLRTEILVEVRVLL